MTPKPQINDDRVRPLDPRSKKAIEKAIKTLVQAHRELTVELTSPDFFATILSGAGPYHIMDTVHLLRAYRQRAGRKARGAK